jgi:hypothetical protein
MARFSRSGYSRQDNREMRARTPIMVGFEIGAHANKRPRHAISGAVLPRFAGSATFVRSINNSL